MIAIVAAVVIAADQLTKTWALDHLQHRPPRHLIWTLQLDVVFNKGIAFSQVTGATAVVTVVALAVLAGLVVVAARTHGTATALVLGLIIGGAIGNLVDRVRFGSVVDFVDFFLGQWHWYVFNLADAAICVGVALLLLDGLLARPESPKA